jgi:hypothetical protein
MDEFTRVMGAGRGVPGRAAGSPLAADAVHALYSWLLEHDARAESMPEDNVIARCAGEMGLDASVEVLSQGEGHGLYVVDVHHPDGGRQALIVFSSLQPDSTQPVLYRAIESPGVTYPRHRQ